VNGTVISRGRGSCVPSSIERPQNAAPPSAAYALGRRGQVVDKRSEPEPRVKYLGAGQKEPRERALGEVVRAVAGESFVVVAPSLATRWLCSP
jgi:hypothetical protein